MGEGEPLEPSRILLISPDSRFTRAASFLLARRGHEVEVVRRPDRCLPLVEEHDFGVVVVDAGHSPGGGSEIRSLLAALAGRAHAVVVADETDPGAPFGAPVIQKWSSVDDLVAEIERSTSPEATTSRS